MASTQIRERQIADGAVTDAKVKAGAAIATSKLEDGAEFVKRDGSVPMTGSLNANNNAVLNVPTPTLSGHAAPKSYIDAAIAALDQAYKYRNVRVASTGNVNISNPGTGTFDGVALSQGDRILLKDQTSAEENGIYVFDTSSTDMVRATDSDAWDELTGTLVSVNEGTTYADARFFCTADTGGAIDGTAVNYVQDTSSGLTGANFVDLETPSGSINGSNTSFSLANTPSPASSVHLYLNGLLQEAGAGNDFTLSGSTITMLTAPISGDKLLCSYRK